MLSLISNPASAQLMDRAARTKAVGCTVCLGRSFVAVHHPASCSNGSRNLPGPRAAVSAAPAAGLQQVGHDASISLLTISRTQTGTRIVAAEETALLSLKVSDLQGHLSQLQLPKSGRKAELVQRLHNALCLAAAAAEVQVGIAQVHGSSEEGQHLYSMLPTQLQQHLAAETQAVSGDHRPASNSRSGRGSVADVPGPDAGLPSTAGAGGRVRRARTATSSTPHLQDQASLQPPGSEQVTTGRQTEVQQQQQQQQQQATPSSRVPRSAVSPRGQAASTHPAVEQGIGSSVGRSGSPRTTSADTAPVPLQHEGQAQGEPFDLSQLPPMPVTRRSKSWVLRERQLEGEELKILLASIPTDLQVAVLGSAALSPAPGRALGALALCRAKDVWLVDGGDDTQRQLGALPHVRPSKVYRFLVTSLAPDCVLGLPGLLCTIGSARMRGHEDTDIPIHIYGPPGLAEYLATIFKVSHTYLEVPVIVFEMWPGHVGEEEQVPSQFNRRARIFRARVPPDQLHPEGGTHAELSMFMPTQGRATAVRGKGARGSVLAHDSRASFIPFPPLTPGDPSLASVPPLDQLTWTFRADVSGSVTAVALPSSTTGAEGAVPTFAYVFEEASRHGNLMVDRLKALGVMPGRDYARIKDNGETIVTSAGIVVTPDMVTTPCKPGRKLVIMGNTAQPPAPTSAFCRLATGTDLLVTGAVAPDETLAGSSSDKASKGKSRTPAQPGAGPLPVLPASEAGRLAGLVRAERLLLGRLWRLEHGGLGADVAVQEAASATAASHTQTPAPAPKQRGRRSSKVSVASQQLEQAVGEAQQQHALVPTTAAQDFDVIVLEKHEGPAPAVDV